MRALIQLPTGPKGHPLHPPFTDATIGAYTVASILGILAVAGVSTSATTNGWWLALLVALCLTVPTAITGLVDWLQITRWTPLWRVATAHLAAMVSASVFFLFALLVGHGDYATGVLGAGPLSLTLIGFALLTLGGSLGGTIVFVTACGYWASRRLRRRPRPRRPGRTSSSGWRDAMTARLQIELARGSDRTPLAEELGARGLEVHEPRNPCRLAVEGASAEELEHMLEGWVPPDEATLVPVLVSTRVIALRPPAG